MDYDIFAMIDDQAFSLDDLNALSKKMEPLVQISNGYIEIQTIKNLKKIIQKLSE